MTRPIITLEEHFCYSEEVLDGKRAKENNPYKFLLRYMKGLREKLLDVGQIRLKDMDANSVSFQVVSHAPMTPTLDNDQCRDANDALAKHVAANSDRFGGFAVLPVSSPAHVAAELRRCVTELGFVGALIDSHTDDGKYFDHEDYLPMFETAQDLNVPIYIHPTYPAENMPQARDSESISPAAASLIDTSSFGWHADVAIHVLRLFGCGIFDKFPRLKIIVGHMGEMLPFMLQRIELTSNFWGLQRDFRTVWKENIWITTSGNWSIDPMACILRNTPISHVLISVDYPFLANNTAQRLLVDLKESGFLNEESLDAIAYRNAEQLLGVKATKTVF